MKKFLFLCVLTLCSIMLTLSSCGSCGQQNGKEEVVAQELPGVMGELVVENFISADKEYMYLHYQKDYSWFETCILLADFLDEECDGKVAGVSDVFQIVTPIGDSMSFDTNVILFSHATNGNQIDIKSGFWIEDCDLSNEPVKLTFKQAFDRVMAANYPKPHSRQCVLRKEVGPINTNPQYIFGNRKAQLYVDAVTGSVSEKNPVFGGASDK